VVRNIPCRMIRLVLQRPGHDYYDGEDYTVSQESVYDFLTDEDDEVEPAEDFLEQYDNSEDAESSDYAEVFEALRNVIDMLE